MSEPLHLYRCTECKLRLSLTHVCPVCVERAAWERSRRAHRPLVLLFLIVLLFGVGLGYRLALLFAR